MLFSPSIRKLGLHIVPAWFSSSSAQTCTFATSTMSDNLLPSATVRLVPDSKLHVSEPDPRWFGNGPNPGFDPAWTNGNWLKSRFHFSFAEYNNPKNSNYGVMRVMNDDLVQPQRGFGEHPHGNMEIVTYIVEGELTHQDSMGTKESLGRGSVQFMTAGTGVRHSEFNHGDQPLRFIQTWIVPSRSGLKPNYGSYNGNTDTGKQERNNQLQHLVGDVTKECVVPVQINQDLNAYVSELELGKSVVHELPPNRQAYLLCVEGSIKVNGQELHRHDACEIMGQSDASTKVEISATGVEDTENGILAHVLMFTMKEVPGSGRTDL